MEAERASKVIERYIDWELSGHSRVNCSFESVSRQM